ncbi:MAG TPA: hypothetical protein VHA30_01945 [Patescibacteria group bacterium]|nr:hypothetical protein [Patescibacteria group bacterium]
MIPSIYLNLEDDVAKVITRLKHNTARQAVLVFPKRSLMFSDSINLRLLKKQVDLLGKEVFILTMDERGQLYAKEAGFALKFLPKTPAGRGVGDIRVARPQAPAAAVLPEKEPAAAIKRRAVLSVKRPAQKPVLQAVAVSSPRPMTDVKINDSIFPRELEQQDRQAAAEQKKNHGHKGLVAMLIISLLIVAALVLVVLPKAEVMIYPKTENVTRDMEISMSTNIGQVDSAALTMPAAKVDETVNVSGVFSSQGKQQVGNKADGTVKIYNFTGAPINLKASTTILTVGSKNYTLAADAFGIKPTSYSNAKTKEVNQDSLSPSVEVVAQDGGEDFNLPAGTRMEITNQVFGSRPQVLYAKTDTEISGGTTRYLSVIGQSDVDAAKNQLQSQAMQEIRDKLKGSGLVLPEQSYSFVVSQFTTDNPVGAQAPSFNASLQAKLSGLAYKDADLQSLISQRITQTIADNKTLVPKGQDAVSVGVKNYDPVGQLATLNVHYEGLAVYEVDLSNIENQLRGKNQAEVNQLLDARPEIDKIEITLAPSWQKTFPWLTKKIRVSVVQPDGSN